MGHCRLLVAGLLALLVAAPAAAQSGSGSDFYPYRGYCGLASVSIRLFGYAETVQIGASLSGAPASYVASFIAWCGSRGVGDEPEAEVPGTCRFDSECSPICEGPVFWKRGCNNVYEGGRIVRKECQKTFETNCAATSVTAGGYSFPNTCNPSAPACVKDAAAIQAKRGELQQKLDGLGEELRNLNRAFEDSETLIRAAGKICSDGLIVVTSSLASTTATLFVGLPTFSALESSLSSVSWTIIKKTAFTLGGKAVPVALSDPAKNDFWLDMCTLQDTLKRVDQPLIEKKQEKLRPQISALQADIKALDAAL